MNRSRTTFAAAAAALALVAGSAWGQARGGLGGVRSGQPRTNGFQGGPPLPPTAPIHSGGGLGGGRGTGSRGNFPHFDRGRLHNDFGGGRGRGMGTSLDTGFHTGSRGFVEGSGLHVDGAFNDDNFRLRFHLGQGFDHRDRFMKGDDGKWRHGNWRDDGHDWRHRHHDHHNHWPTVWPYYGYYYDTGSYGIGWPWGTYDPYLTQPAYYTPPPQPEPEVYEPMTDREVGDAALALGEPRGAIKAYRAHLDVSPEDAEAMRLLGVAMLDARTPRDGIAMVALAYRTDPRLCGKPLPMGVVGSRGDLRALVNRASVFANNTGSASAWLTMAVLVQAEGRLDVAARIIERARAAGLDPALADKFLAALGPDAAALPPQ